MNEWMPVPSLGPRFEANVDVVLAMEELGAGIEEIRQFVHACLRDGEKRRLIRVLREDLAVSAG